MMLASIFLTVPPMTMAPERIIRFLMMYCPSRVGNQKMPFWKVISGRINKGRKVPNICMKSKPMASRVVDLKRNKTPMRTSHQPMMATH